MQKEKTENMVVHWSQVREDGLALWVYLVTKFTVFNYLDNYIHDTWELSLKNEKEYCKQEKKNIFLHSFLTVINHNSEYW